MKYPAAVALLVLALSSCGKKEEVKTFHQAFARRKGSVNRRRIGKTPIRKSRAKSSVHPEAPVILWQDKEMSSEKARSRYEA